MGEPDRPDRFGRRPFLAGLGAVAAAATGGALAGCGTGAARDTTVRRTRGQPTAAARRAATALAGTAAADGSTVTAAVPIGGRAVDVLVDSHALAAAAPTRLLIPDGFVPASRRSWPVLYLLHGADADYAAWTTYSDVETLTAGSQALVVMPDAGRWGWYTDWWNRGRHGPPAWETFHLTELAQILDRSLRAGDDRAVAGFSMGGMGAMSYAGRHPGTWRAAAAFSGQLDLTDDRPTPLGSTQPRFLMETAASLGLDPLGCWGDPVAQADLWAAHNPRHLVGGLAGVALYVASGDGQPGPFDPPGTSTRSVQSVYEAGLYPTTQSFLSVLGHAGRPVTTDLYGAGTHTWPYWQRDLHRSWPLLRAAIGA